MTEHEGRGRRSRLAENDDVTPGEALALLDSERVRVVAALEPDARLVYGVFGTAWLLGFGALYCARSETGPVEVSLGAAGIAFFALLGGAMLVVAVHLARRFAGLRGVSSRVGTMYASSWGFGFAGYAALMSAAGRAGVSEPTIGLLWSAGSGLIVGLLYLSAGALWQDRVQYGLGGWIVACSAAGALAGAPGVYLVMSLAGGGGLLLAAALLAIHRHRAGRPVVR